MLKETLTPYIVYMAMNLHWFILALFSGTAVLAYVRTRRIWMQRKDRMPGTVPPTPPLPPMSSASYTFNAEDFSRLSQEFYAKHIQNLSERHPSLLVRQLATEMRCMAHNHKLELESKTVRPRIIQVGTTIVRTLELAEQAWDQTGGLLELDKRRYLNNLRRLIYQENTQLANAVSELNTDPDQSSALASNSIMGRPVWKDKPKEDARPDAQPKLPWEIPPVSPLKTTLFQPKNRNEHEQA